MLSMENYPLTVTPAVKDYLEQFEFSDDPSQVLQAYDTVRDLASDGDPDAIHDLGNFLLALSLYPEDCAQNPQQAAELYRTFAMSDNPTHAEAIVRMLPGLREYDKDAAKSIAQDCLLRPRLTAAEMRLHITLESVLYTSYLVGKAIVDGETEDGIVLLSAERLKRRPPRAS